MTKTIHWYQEIAKKNKQKSFRKKFAQIDGQSSLGKPWKIWENIEVSSLPKLKQEGVIWYKNQTTIQELFFRKCINNRNEQQKHNKQVYSGQSILEISKLVMHEFYCNYVNRKCGEKVK